MKKWLLIAIVVICVLAIPAGFYGFKLFGKYNTSKEFTLRVHNNWSLKQLATALATNIYLEPNEQKDFQTWAARLGYEKVRACFVTIPQNASLYDIVKILKQNRRQTRNLVIKGGWDAATLSKYVADNIEVNEDFLYHLLTSPQGKFGEPLPFNDTSWPAFFIPNTYNFYVSDSIEVLLEKMQSAHDKFWNNIRKNKAVEQGLDPSQVAIIASIVSKESNKTDEYENIAGVYINRLRKNMLLQADPTVVYARKKSGRVLGNDLKIPSPYNTYLHKGLPPGPICIPNVASYDAVLNYTQHKYLYFCAKSDFSGYHNFAETWEAHLVNARAFHKALDERK